MRVWARLDTLERITFRSSADLTAPPESVAAAVHPPSVTPDLLSRTIVVVDEASGQMYMRADAVAQILRAFPAGWLWSLPLRLPGLRALANWGYNLFSRRRETISAWLGLAACSVPPRPTTPEPAPLSPADAPLVPPPVAVEPPPVGASPPPAGLAAAARDVPAVRRSAVCAAGRRFTGRTAAARAASGHRRFIDRWHRCVPPRQPPSHPGVPPYREQLRRVLSIFREGAVLAMIVVLVSETLFINAAVPRFLKHEQPIWIKRLVAYPRLIQAWSMFASDAPTDRSDDGGRRRDGQQAATSIPTARRPPAMPNPGRERRSRPASTTTRVVFNYSGRIPASGAYFQALTEWILAYHERTGDDAIGSSASTLRGRPTTARPSASCKPRNVRSHIFLGYPPSVKHPDPRAPNLSHTAASRAQGGERHSRSGRRA